MSGLQIHHKRNAHVLRWMLTLVLFAAIIAYAYFGIRWYNTGELSPLPLPVAAADSSINENPIDQKQIESHTVPADQPRYIEIPKLGISEARVARVGVTANNMLDAPKTLDDAGWYAKSSTPGSGIGAVLIDGHSEGVTRDGVFGKLDTLVPGDQITIERGDGERFTYEVHDVRDMPLEWVNKTGMKEMMLSVEPDKEGLSLVTSSGKWIPKDKVFDRRILVRATIVE